MNASASTRNIPVGILIGGASRRMGCPKALILIEGTTMIERTVRIARCIADDIFLIGEPTFAFPDSISAVPIIHDLHPGIGPIGGLETMLVEFVGQPCILVACDMPRLSEALLQRIAAAGGDFDAAVCRTAGRWHPCCGLYRPSTLGRVRAAIVSRRFGMIALLGKLNVLPIELTGEDACTVENWNEPSDIRPPRKPKDP